jgi:hypothetical protein
MQVVDGTPIARDGAVRSSAAQVLACKNWGRARCPICSIGRMEHIRHARSKQFAQQCNSVHTSGAGDLCSGDPACTATHTDHRTSASPPLPAPAGAGDDACVHGGGAACKSGRCCSMSAADRTAAQAAAMVWPPWPRRPHHMFGQTGARTHCIQLNGTRDAAASFGRMLRCSVAARHTRIPAGWRCCSPCCPDLPGGIKGHRLSATIWSTVRRTNSES